MVDEYNLNGAVDDRLAMTGTPAVGAVLPLPPPSARPPAPGVAGAAAGADGAQDSPPPPFGGVDPTVVGGVIGFLFTVAALTALAGGQH